MPFLDKRILFTVTFCALIVLWGLTPATVQGATFNVGTAADLIAAIDTANTNGTNDTITLTADITLTVIENSYFDTNDNFKWYGNNGLPVIRDSGSLTIEGAGNTITRSNEEFRFFLVTTGAELTLQNITLTNGAATQTSFAGYGGAILNNGGILTVSNSTLSGHSAVTSGGAIFNNGGRLRVLDSIFFSNEATGDSGYGGAIHHDDANGDLFILNSEFRGNKTANDGGALAVLASDDTLITNSLFSGNVADGEFVANGGGAIHVGANPIDMTLTNVTIAENYAGGDSGAIGSNSSGTIALRNTLIWGNDAPSRPQVFSLGTLEMTNSAIQDLNGDGVSGVFTDNGGNIDLAATDTLFVAPQPASATPNTAGIYSLRPINPVVNEGHNTFLSENTGGNLDYNGNGVIVSTDIPNDLSGNARVVGTSVDIGTYEGDDVCPFYEPYYDGTLETTYTIGTAGNPAADAEQDLEFAIFCANQNSSNDQIDLGGAVVTLDDGNFTNTASILLNDVGLPPIESVITIQNGTLDRDETGDEFGILSVRSGNLTSNLLLDNVTVSDGGGSNLIANGGGVYVGAEGLLFVSNGSVFQNNSAQNGGAIHTEGFLVVQDSDFLENQASFDGGAIGQFSSVYGMTLYNATFRGNKAGDDGGALVVLDSNDVIITNSLFSGNVADGEFEANGGGAIFLDNNPIDMTLTNVTIAGNYAGGDAGAIGSNSSGTIFMRNTLIWGNDAPSRPQIAVFDTLEITNSAIQDLNGVGVFGIFTDNGGNIDLNATDPVFVSPGAAGTTATTTGDYDLLVTPSNPVIDQGDNSFLNELDGGPGGISIDYNGDGGVALVIPDDLNGGDRVACVAVDIGANEVNTDMNCDDYITPADAVYVLNRIGTGDLSADVDGDDDIDADDFNAVQALIGTTP